MKKFFVALLIIGAAFYFFKRGPKPVSLTEAVPDLQSKLEQAGDNKEAQMTAFQEFSDAVYEQSDLEQRMAPVNCDQIDKPVGVGNVVGWMYFPYQTQAIQDPRSPGDSARLFDIIPGDILPIKEHKDPHYGWLYNGYVRISKHGKAGWVKNSDIYCLPELP